MNSSAAFNRTDSSASGFSENQVRDPRPNSILIVDDNVMLCRSLQLILEREGFAVSLEHTLASGLMRVAKDRFEIVLLDIVLPDGDGSIALSEFRDISGSPVIMMTGTGDDATREACMQGGAAGYLSKPFPIPHLLTMLRRNIEKAMK
jgi:two-component system NtrC family response regulator